ncbi:hypothetical protein UI24_16630 [Mycobacteroides franklinii]|nr:hypothetical protein [Mycobacteroides franklinii]
MFLAQFTSKCGRCRRIIHPGGYARVMAEYGTVHDGCHNLESGNVIAGARHPSVCTKCFLAHAGECP